MIVDYKKIARKTPMLNKKKVTDIKISLSTSQLIKFTMVNMIKILWSLKKLGIRSQI